MKKSAKQITKTNKTTDRRWLNKKAQINKAGLNSVLAQA